MATSVTVRGNVQGVFFRANTRDLARQHGLTGWVRNDPQGTVSAHLEGDPDAIDQVVGWMRDGGPPRARVDEVTTDDVPDEGHDRFEVRR